ncbi:MAG TPA: tryptophan 2,3-dioxygenase family protein [Gammaproteobacteria bacterium]|nr:tryptophan 2,3-dioxygenase family protein [Gammaproteobacteria bacterium]
MNGKTGEDKHVSEGEKDAASEAVEAPAGVRYDTYLQLDKLLSAQRPVASHHDEMLFIIQHQVAELWFKLVLHELDSAIECLKQDELARAIKNLRRVTTVQQQLTAQWSVLATLTPRDYAAFRDSLGTASGFQSPQYRVLEFKLGNKARQMLPMFRHHLEYYRMLKRALESPSLYDEFLRYLYRVGHRVPLERVERDWTERYEHHPGVVDVFQVIYEHPEEYWAAYEVSERLVDIEINFQSWRFQHMKTVERIIGNKPGTAGTAGVKFLKKALEISFFPELTEVRTRIGAPR